jgi:hypothetical protein
MSDTLKVTCVIYEYPEEKVQMHIRRAAGGRADVIDAVNSAIKSRIGGETLIGVYGRVEDNGVNKCHCRYKMINMNCMLEPLRLAIP